MARLSMALAAFLAVAAGAEGATKAQLVTVGDKSAIIGLPFDAKPLVEIKDLRFYTATAVPGGKPCSIVTGYVVSHLPSAAYVVTVTVDMLKVPGSDRAEYGKIATFAGTALRPKPGQPERFTALGGPCRRDDLGVPGGEQYHYAYSVTFSVRRVTPEDDAP